VTNLHGRARPLKGPDETQGRLLKFTQRTMGKDLFPNFREVIDRTVNPMTRLTNAFSKKVENLEHAVALHFMHYNFCRIHTSLRVTPAMEAGVADHVWSLEEVVALLD
jgi:hypothetical protein